MTSLFWRLFKGAERRRRAGSTLFLSGAARLLGEVEPRRRPLAITRGDVPLGRRVVLFCHYDRSGQASEGMRRYVDALIQAGLSVVFVTNSGRLAEEAKGWVRERCALVVERRNAGFDFAAWQDGLEAAGLPRSDTEILVIANDSVCGPFAPLTSVLERFDFEKADVWGLTDSWQIRYHLQSYFMTFGPAAFRSPAFARFWGGVRDLRLKRAVIRSYEVQLTQLLLQAGLRCEALWPYDGLIRLLQEEAEPVGGIGEMHRLQEIEHATRRDFDCR